MISDIVGAIDIADGADTVGTAPDVAGQGWSTRTSVGRNVCPVRHIRHDDRMNELHQGTGNDIQGVNKMKMLAWLSGGTIISEVHMIGWLYMIVSYWNKKFADCESIAQKVTVSTD